MHTEEALSDDALWLVGDDTLWLTGALWHAAVIDDALVAQSDSGDIIALPMRCANVKQVR